MSGLSRCMQALTLWSSFIWRPAERLQNMTGERGNGVPSSKWRDQSLAALTRVYTAE